ncbi:hypothetical protein ATANTOWER_012310 [Ataeniobius toweri]|uniref:Uncharacterized protein n=1 Tax=Ataeniobius toweri TaxID=208326 RepID=A0ABU7AXK5_9TELE|nr:hypothetical protein [Ataeniobius toweri]
MSLTNVESILTSSITVWYGSTTAVHCKHLQRVVKTAEKITRTLRRSPSARTPLLRLEMNLEALAVSEPDLDSYPPWKCVLGAVGGPPIIDPLT